MKKITALVLALVMTLSLLPMNVWAAGESGSGQLYWNYDPQNPQWRTGSLHEEFGGSSWLDLATDISGTPLASDWAVFASPTDLGSVSKAQDGRLCWDRSMVRNPVSGEIVVTSGTMTYAIPAQVGEPSISVYSTKPIGDGSVATYTDVQYADFDNNYVYTSGNNAKIYLVAKYDDMKFAGTSGVEESWVSIAGDGKSITITIPRDVSGQQEFQVLCNWVDSGGNVVRTDNRYFRFRDTNDQSDLFARAVWGNGEIKDFWNLGRFSGQAGEQMTVEFALPPENASQPADDAVMSLEGADVTVSENLGTAKISGNQVLWDCTTLIPGTTGSLKITKGETTYNVPVMVTPPLVGVYSDAPNYDNLGTYYLTFDENRCYTYESGASEPQVFYLLAREGMTFEDIPDECFAIVENSDNRLATYTIPADSYGMKIVDVSLWSSWESRKIPYSIGFDQEGGSSNDGRIHYEYTTSRGNSILVVSVMPEQLEVINLPKSGRLENDTLTVTLKTADPTLWLPLLYNDDGLLVHFEVFPAINGERIECEPQIAEYAATLPLEDQNGEKGLISLLLRDLMEGHDAFFKGYNAPTARLNGLYYAWSSEENDGDITLIPNDDKLNYAWVWNYEGVEALPEISEDWLPDGYCLRFVMSDEISGAITLKANPAVEAQRIKLVQHAAKESTKDTVEALFHFKENRLGTFTYEEDGVLTYLYDGDDKTFAGSTEEIKKAVDNTEGAWIYDDNLPGYNVLEITAPKNCVPKALTGSYVGMTYDINNAPPTIVLPYRWLGLGTEHIYALTWYNTVTHKDYTEQLVIKTPSVDGAEKWMDRFGRRISTDRVQYTELPDDCGASISYEDGFILTTFDNDVIIDVNTILDAQVVISVPEVMLEGTEEAVKPVELRILPWGYDGTDDPTLNYRTEGLVEAFRMDIDNKAVTKVSDIPVATDGQQKVSIYLDPLKKQAIGDIEYYYSADRMTHFALMRWDFADGSRLYEYMEIETTNYFCQWEEELKADREVTGAVEVPTAVNDSLANSNIMLISRMHPQKQEKGYGQYFFELQMVDEGEGNVYTDTEGTTYFTIILPYSFMGEDWNYEKAKNLKEKPMITHFDKNFKKLVKDGEITGEYTERGIEFKVNSFSPFTVSWTEETVDTTPSYPGGYYPIVTPETTPVEKPTETKPTTPAQTTTPPAEVTVPVSGDEHTINVEASVSGTTATIDKVDMTKLEGVIGDDVAVGTVTIDFSVLDKAIDTVEIPADVVKEIAAAVNDPNNDAKSLEVVLNDGMSIEFDAKALANKAAQADGLDITISMKHAKDSAINDQQKSAIGDRVAFDINVTSGGEHITDMGGEVIVHAPYVLRDGEEAAGIVVCYVDDAGNKEKCETNYDSVKQCVNWKTTHFSVYMIDYDATLVDDGAADAPPVVDDAPQSEATNDIGLWIGVALVVLVIAIVIVAVAIKRKK